MARVFVSIGSNLDPETNIMAALQVFREDFGENLLCSSVYKSEAEGFDGPDFLNLVVAFHTSLSPSEIVCVFKHMEVKQGRDALSPSFSNRTLDLDLLLYDNLILTEATLAIPRGEIERYAFVLCPLAEIAPELKHPVTQQSYASMWAQFSEKHTQPLQKIVL